MAAKGCFRCGGWVAQPREANVGADHGVIVVAINLCRSCEQKARLENRAAYERRTGQ